MYGDKDELVIQEKGLLEKLSEWVNSVWEWLGSRLGIRDLSVEQIQNLTLDKFVNGAVADIFSGRSVPGSVFGISNQLPNRKQQEPDNNESNRIASNAVMPRSAKSVSEAQELIRPLINKPIVNKKLGITATISGKSISKLGSQIATGQSVSAELHAKAVANIDILFQNAEFDVTHPDYKGDRNVEKIHRLGALMYDEKSGEYVPVMLTVKEFNNDKGNRIYTVEAVDIEAKEKPAGLLTDAQINEGHVPIAGFENFDNKEDAIKNFNVKIQQLIEIAKGNSLEIVNENSQQRKKDLEKAENGTTFAPKKDLLDDVFNEKGEIDYKKLNRAADAIEEGRASLDRLLVGAESGRTKGGRRNVEASIILGASESANRRTSQGVLSEKELKEVRARQEKLIEDYARKGKIWFDYKEATKGKPLDRGRESTVYYDKTQSVVRKITYPYADATTLLEFLDNKVSLNNHLFSETQYKLVGFTRSKNGAFMVILEQPYIKHSAQTIGDQVIFEKYKDYLRQSGWNFDKDNIFTIWNDDYIVYDLYEDNILIDNDGNFYFIDTNPNQRKSGTDNNGNLNEESSETVLEETTRFHAGAEKQWLDELEYGNNGKETRYQISKRNQNIDAMFRERFETIFGFDMKSYISVENEGRIFSHIKCQNYTMGLRTNKHQISYV
jgi:hypothetical protein